jgi:ribonuclease R
VALDSVYVEGLVHVSELGEDYFQYDKMKHQMLGERSGKRYRLGDRLHVQLVRADLETGRIDFILAAAPASAPPPETSRQPAAKPVRKPAAKPAAKVVVKPVVKRVAKPVAKSSEKATGKVSRTKPRSVAAPAKKPVAKKKSR